MSIRIPTQLTTLHSLRGRTGLERHDVEADVDEGVPRSQFATDSVAFASVSHQLQPPGKGAIACAGSVETHCWLWTTGCFRDRPQQTTVLPTQPPRPRPLPTTTRWLEGRCPVVSNRKCSKDVTTHQHWLRARPRHPCPSLPPAVWSHCPAREAPHYGT